MNISKELIVNRYKQGASIKDLTSMIYYNTDLEREGGKKQRIKREDAQKMVEEAVLEYYLRNVAHG